MKTNWKWLFIFILVILNGFLYSLILGFLHQSEFELSFLPVGQGDASLIKIGRNFILIDTGPGTKILTELDKIIPVYKRRLDLILISHPNVDHYGGLPEVLKRYEVGAVMMNGIKTEQGSFKNLQEAIKNSQTLLVFGRAGQLIESGKMKFSIVWPGLELPLGINLPDKQLNDSSLVGLLEFQDFSGVFAGDISANAEKVLAKILPDVDLLKVAHHGSKYSSSESFLAMLKPELAIIEVGKNSYGHPTLEALTRLQNIGAQIFRTDVDGLIKMVWENGELKIF